MGTALEGIYKSDDDGATWQIAGAQPSDPPPPRPLPPPVDVTAKLNVSIEDLNGSAAIEVGTRARFRVTVRNAGPEVSTDTFVHFNWVLPNTNDASSLAITLSSNAGACIVQRNSDVGCSVGTLAVGQSVTIDFDGTTSTSFIGDHKISVTARNAEGADVVANDSVATKKSVACFGDCSGSSSGGGGSAGLSLLVVLTMLALGRRRQQVPTRE
jgi:MYXO-CTERM domain-containing protein